MKMKRTYEQPNVIVVKMEQTNTLLNASGVNSSNGIGFGGADNDGTIIPE